MKYIRLRILSILFFLILADNGYSQTIQIFPDDAIYKKYYADALSHQFSLLKHFGSNEWFGNIGMEKPLLNFIFDDNMYQFTIAATVFNTLKITPPHIQVFTADYLLDFFLDHEVGNDFTIRFNWGHLSAHYSDDGILQLNQKSINYVRDYIGLQSEKFIGFINGKVYLAVTYNFHNEPRKEKHARLQFGFDAGRQVAENFLIYFAFDLKMKAEVNNGTTKAFQVGLKYPKNGLSNIRIAYTFRTGYEERGQLYDESNSKHLLGLYFDF
jgi:hypothetical protein